MTIKYLDPYKDDPYGKLRGDKGEAYFKVAFDEGKFYPTENGYILAAYVNSYSGVVRSFKAEQPLEQGLCAIPFYSDEYEIRQKVNGEWTSTKVPPSVFEKFLCTYIKANESIFMPDDKGLNGEIAHVPNGMCASMDGEAMTELIRNSIKITPIPLQGLLKPYAPPTSYQRRSGGGGYSKGISPDEKLTFVKSQLALELGDETLKEDTTLGVLIDQMVSKYPMDKDFIAIYFDTLAAIVS